MLGLRPDLPQEFHKGGKVMKEYNIVITGIGGQGVMTLAMVLAEAAFKEGLDVTTAELHGLAQRGGTIPCHVRFGKKIFSPLVLEGKADLVIGLEPLETLRAAYYGSKEVGTIFVTDTKKIIPITVSLYKEKYPELSEMKKLLKGFGRGVIMLNASDIVNKEFGSNLSANIYILGYAFARGLIPLKKKDILEGMRKVVPEKLFEINQKVFELGIKQGG